MARVKFNYADRKLSLSDKSNLKLFIISLFEEEKTKLDELNYIFCSDEYLLQINKDHLNHDYYTDIITFSLEEEDNPIIGEIYISLDRIKENALTQKTNLLNETLRVIFHGSLHLCRYLDKKPKDIKLMREKEDYYINQYLSK
jgi:rRNA maturation RNase YbeY